MKSRTIKVDRLARVEGEGALYVKITDGSVADVKFSIFEPPRFFEAFLRERMYYEVPDITARICGICPVAYQMSSVHAIENAFGVTVGGQLRDLRRLLYCGEWIESHALHIYLLHAPDFLGAEDAIELARKSPELVTKALRLKKTGNDIVTLLGGREIHPINVRVGGFYRVPTRRDLEALVDRLRWARDAAIETVRLVAGFDFPALEMEYEFVALRHPTEYAMSEGRFVSSSGLDIAVQEYEFHFEERQVAHSNALTSTAKGFGNYHVGPLARVTLNFDRLSPLTLEVCREIRFAPPVRNPFRSIIARAIETVYACDEALRICDQYEQPATAALDVVPRAGIGFGATEAPRGTLYHRYRLRSDGIVLDAKIVPPTAQNQPTIERDVRQLVTNHLELPREDLTWKCEQAVRNYDPCISCATHFVRLDIQP